MEYVLIFGSIIFGCALLSWSWVRGIDYMKDNHPDYKGEDFLDWGKDDQPNILSKASKEKIVDDIKTKGLYTESKVKGKKKRNWEEDLELGGSE